MTRFKPAWWLPGPHAQTLWGKLFRRETPPATNMERWHTVDGDFVDVYRLKNPRASVHLLILHGLEGTVRSKYAQALFTEAQHRGWAADMLIFRSCSDEMNWTKRFYHSGDTGDVAMVIARILADDPDAVLVCVGVSLGGNVLLKYLGESGSHLPQQIRSAVAISVPFDLHKASRHIDRGFAKVYQRHFIRSLKKKTLTKLQRFPDLIDHSRLATLGTMFEFDDALTAPLHGFRDAADYYVQSSSLRWLDRISIPTLLISAADDPFLPRVVLDDVRSVASRNPCLQVEFHEHGGHVGFVHGGNPLRPRYYAEARACDFLANYVTRDIALQNQRQPR